MIRQSAHNPVVCAWFAFSSYRILLYNVMNHNHSVHNMWEFNNALFCCLNIAGLPCHSWHVWYHSWWICQYVDVIGPEVVRSSLDRCHCILERHIRANARIVKIGQNVHFAVTTNADVECFFSNYSQLLTLQHAIWLQKRYACLSFCTGNF